MKLTKSQIWQRKCAGLSVDGIEVSEEKPRQVSSGVAHLVEQWRASIIDLPTLEERVVAGNFLGSFEDISSKLREACRTDTRFASAKDSIEILATFDDYCYVMDWQNDKYFEVEYEVDRGGVPRITNVKTVEPRDMVERQGELLHSVLRENLIGCEEAAVPKIQKIARHLCDFEKQLLLG